MIGVRVLAPPLADIRAECSVVDAPSWCSVNERFDRANTRRRHHPPRDDRDLSGNEKGPPDRKVNTADNATRFERVVVYLERGGQFRVIGIICPDADGAVVESVPEITNSNLAGKPAVCACGKPWMERSGIKPQFPVLDRAAWFAIDNGLNPGCAGICQRPTRDNEVAISDDVREAAGRLDDADDAAWGSGYVSRRCLFRSSRGGGIGSFALLSLMRVRAGVCGRFGCGS